MKLKIRNEVIFAFVLLLLNPVAPILCQDKYDLDTAGNILFDTFLSKGLAVGIKSDGAEVGQIEMFFLSPNRNNIHVEATVSKFGKDSEHSTLMLNAEGWGFKTQGMPEHALSEDHVRKLIDFLDREKIVASKHSMLSYLEAENFTKGELIGGVTYLSFEVEPTQFPTLRRFMDTYFTPLVLKGKKLILMPSRNSGSNR